MLARISLILLLLISSSTQSVHAESLKSELERSAPKQTKCFKGLELYLWQLDGKPVWTILPGTNRLKFDKEIHNPKEAIKSFSELEKLLRKLAPGEYVIFTDDTRKVPNPAPAVPSKESVALKKLCDKLGLNYSGPTSE